MLFSYTHVPHAMDKMQKFVQFIVLDVWCQASPAVSFDLSLFDGCSDLKELMTSFFYDDTKAGDAFYNAVQTIYQEFCRLSPQDRAKFRHWYQGNNDIEKICGDPVGHHVVRYDDFEGQFPGLRQPLYAFFKSLYSQELLGLAALRKHIGDLKEHYDQFVTVNTVGKCPFCGMTDLKSVYHTHREAYDHYFPKSIYPFNSINFRNLVPACHECNSTYKSAKDPAYLPKDKRKPGHPRRAFYPYSTTPHSVTVSVTLNHCDLGNLKPDDVHLNFAPAAAEEEIETWVDVYGIEERYRAKFCDGDAKAWLEEFRISNRRRNTSPQEFVDDVHEQFISSPFANLNFLKKPFVDELRRQGALDAVAASRRAVGTQQQSGAV